MSWVGPTAKSAAKYGVKYGPHVKVAWQVGGKRARSAATAKLEAVSARRKAFDQASVTTDGSVLRVVAHGEPVFVVFAQDDPIASYPEVETPLDQLIERADLSKRLTPEQRREQQLRTKVQRVRKSTRRATRAPAPARDDTPRL